MRIRVDLQRQIAIKALKEKRTSLTYLDIYAETGIATSTLSQINTGSTNVMLSTLEKLCNYFNCDPGELLVRERP